SAPGASLARPPSRRAGGLLPARACRDPPAPGALSRYGARSLCTSALSLHDALPICPAGYRVPTFDEINGFIKDIDTNKTAQENEIEEHTSELQSRFDLVCRLLLAKKKLPTAGGVYVCETMTDPQQRAQIVTGRLSRS